MLMASTGCAVNQAREVGEYRSVIELQPAQHTAGEPLRLRDAVLLANAQLEDLDIEGEGYLRALIERRRAVAGFLPTVNLNGSHIWRDDADDSGSDSGSSNTGASRASSGSSSGNGSSGSDGDSDGGSGGTGGSSGASSSASSSRSSGSSSSSGDDDSYTINGRLEWNIFNGFRDWNSYWRDTFLIEQRRHLLLELQEQTLLDVARVFLEVLRAEASVRVIESSLEVQAERLRNSRGRFEVGLGRALDVAQGEAQYSATATQLVNARRDVQNARDLLSYLTAEELTSTPLVMPPVAPPLSDDVEALVQAAQTEREDLRAAAAALSAAERDLKVALGQYYPRVSLNLDAYLVSEPIPNPRDWQAALQVTQPLFAAGRIRADVRESWSFIREARLVQERLLREVRRDVQTARRDLMTSDERLRQLAIQTDAARQAFDQAEASYSIGLATNLDRVSAQDALLRAQLAQTSELFDNKLYYLQVLHAGGSLRERFFEAEPDGSTPAVPTAAAMPTEAATAAAPDSPAATE